ncbi:MAG: hypothetical protein JNM51_00345, partial [Bacteroidia bacterium]|nr:hypothetical protein [Bacteroidia bacterium]
LASCVGLSIDLFFKEILFDLAEKLEVDITSYNSGTFSEISKSIITLLEKNFSKDTCYIFIEEIPIGSNVDVKEFAEKMFSLIISKSLLKGMENIRFILSSINSPVSYVQNYNQKVFQYFKFIELSYWEEQVIFKLIDLIETDFKYTLVSKSKQDLVKSAKGSPRFVKKVYRSVYYLDKSDEITVS